MTTNQAVLLKLAIGALLALLVVAWASLSLSARFQVAAAHTYETPPPAATAAPEASASAVAPTPASPASGTGLAEQQSRRVEMSLIAAVLTALVAAVLGIEIHRRRNSR